MRRNEELTDATAVMAGFGPLLLRTVYREAFAASENGVDVHGDCLGYLPPKALVYLSAVQLEMAGGSRKQLRHWLDPWLVPALDWTDNLWNR